MKSYLIGIFAVLAFLIPAAWAPMNNCPTITTSGLFLMYTSSIGASNNAYPLAGSACVKIEASNVIFDCNGWTITGLGATGTTYGILINGSLTNVTVRNCRRVANYTYGIYVLRSSNINLTGDAAYSNTNAAIMLNSSDNGTITSSTGASNSGYGIYLLSSNSNAITNTSGTSNSSVGMYALSSSNNVISKSSAMNKRPGASGYGLYITSGSNYNSVINSAVSGSSYGLYLDLSNGTLLSNVHYYNNSFDFFVNGASSFNMSNAIFDSPPGNFQNFTNLTVNDSVGSGESYYVKWTANTAALPAGYSSFAQKFVNITAVSGTPSIDYAAWSWTTGELGGYNENKFGLFGYAGSWQLLNGAPDTTDHQLSVTGLTPSAVYGILESN